MQQDQDPPLETPSGNHGFLIPAATIERRTSQIVPAERIPFH